MKPVKLVSVGAGYFSAFHLEAWKRIPEVELCAICDLDESRVRQAAENYGIPRFYTDFEEMLSKERPQIVDIITPPATHFELCRMAADRGIHIICQKPLAPELEEAAGIVDHAARAGVRFMVHENFRFQPWFRKMKVLLSEAAIGDRLHTLQFRMRTGDGWTDDAYLDRQLYFREMPRLLIYETGIHYIDGFRFLAGDIHRVFASLRRLNPNIAGEDCGMVWFEFGNGSEGIWDANRFNEPNTGNPRYTFGEILVEGNGGSLRLYTDGKLTIQELGRPETPVSYSHEDRNFASDCVYATQRHFVDSFLAGTPFETGGKDYLENLCVQEAVYESNRLGRPVEVVRQVSKGVDK